MAAADAEQLRAVGDAEPCRHHDQGPDSPLPAFLGDAEHGRGRRGDDRQVDRLGQRGHRRQAAHAFQLAATRVDRVDPAGEAAGDDVPQDRPAGRAGAPTRADHRDRRRGQHMAQAGHVSRPLPLGDRVTISAQGGVGLVSGQRELELVHPVRQRTLRLQPGIGEHLQHELVLVQRFRDQGAYPLGAGQRDQVLQQQRADPALMHVVDDRESDLRHRMAAAEPLVGAVADHLAVQHRQQRGMIWCGLPAYPARRLLSRGRAQAEKTQVQVVAGHLLVHVPHRIEITGPRRPDLHRGPIGQQSVSAPPRLYSQRRLLGLADTQYRTWPHYRSRR